MKAPSVTIAIATYARVKWLEEALHSAIDQSYPGSVDILILNDCQRQTLLSPHPRVHVINTPTHFPTLGDKRNHLLTACRGEWVAFLDDDDVLMPWHLSRIINACQASERTAASTHSFFMDGEKGGLAPPCLMDIAVEKMFALSCGGFASLDNKDEHAFIANLEKVSPLFRVDTESNPSYVYMWGNGVHHISGNGDPYGGKGFRADAKERMDRGVEPTGTIFLRPHWRRDYATIVKEAVK